MAVALAAAVLVGRPPHSVPSNYHKSFTELPWLLPVVGRPPHSMSSNARMDFGGTAFLNERFAQWATGGHSQQQSIVTSIRFFPPPPPPFACSVGCCRRLHGRGMSKRRDPGSKLVSWFLALLWYSLFSLWAWPLSS